MNFVFNIYFVIAKIMIMKTKWNFMQKIETKNYFKFIQNFINAINFYFDFVMIIIVIGIVIIKNIHLCLTKIE